MCQPPAVWRDEVAAYRANAEAGVWRGPRYAMNYRVQGTGPALVIAPGFSDGPDGYSLLVNQLAKHFRTILYRYPGSVSNDGARLSRFHHSELVDDLIGFVDHLELAPANVLGISFGTSIVLGALHRASDRFRKVVLQGPLGRRRYTPAERLGLWLGRRVPRFLRRLPLRDRVLLWNHAPEFGRPVRDRWVLYRDQNFETPVTALAHRAALLAECDLTPYLPAMPHEVLVLRGNEDRMAPKAWYQQLTTQLPRARGCVLPVAGHLLHYTHVERVAEMMTEFLQR
jgi:pimeloyl-ACP methyl ester carboxylesterase